MADKKISQLPALQELDGNEDFAVAKEGANYKVSTKNLLKGNVRYDSTQELTTTEQLRARANIAAMANTPSGDPMHYMYEQAGAVWNAETGYWELNTLTDLTTAEMRKIYAEAHISKSKTDAEGYWQECTSRTNISNIIWSASSAQLMFKNCSNLVVAKLAFGNLSANITALNSAFSNCEKLKVIINIISLYTSSTVNNAFDGCFELETVYIRSLTKSISFANSPNLSVESGEYAIIKNAATSPITITVHHDAYVRFMADPTILAALEAHPLVTLADAGEPA